MFVRICVCGNTCVHVPGHSVTSAVGLRVVRDVKSNDKRLCL